MEKRTAKRIYQNANLKTEKKNYLAKNKTKRSKAKEKDEGTSKATQDNDGEWLSLHEK